MTTQPEAEESAPRQMKCLRRLYVMEDEAGRTWLAVEEAPTESPIEGGAMSHRSVGGADPTSEDDGVQGGGAMSHLIPGDLVDVEGDGADQVTLPVPEKPGLLPHRMQAYRVSPALLPTGVDPTST